MMKLARCLTALVLLGTVVGVAVAEDLPTVVGAVAVGFMLRAVLGGGFARAFRAVLPVMLFAAVLAGMQWVSRTPVTYLGLKTVAVFLLATLAFRVLPWSELWGLIGPHSRLFGLVLYALFIRHFVAIFGSEARRLFQARAFCVSRAYGRGSFRSLVAAVTALFSRSLARAERFYAAQWLQGWGE